MDRILMLLLVLILIPTAFAQENLYLEYIKNITFLPNSNQTLSLFIKNLGESRLRLNISCESILLVECPSRVELDPGESKVVLIRIEIKEPIGIYPIHLRVGEKEAVIMVKVSNLPKVLFEILEYYNMILNRLIEVGENNIHELKNAKLSLKVTYELCEYGLYERCAEKLEEARKQIEVGIEKMVERKLEKGEKEEEKGISNFTFSPYLLIFFTSTFLFVGGLSYFLLKRTHKGAPSFYTDLSKIKELIGKPPLLKEVEKGKSSLSSIEREIALMEKYGKDVTELKLLLKLLKKEKKEGHLNLVKRYLKRLRVELDKLWSSM